MLDVERKLFVEYLPKEREIWMSGVCWAVYVEYLSIKILNIVFTLRSQDIGTIIILQSNVNAADICIGWNK
jgi:hypothetical protein